MSKSSHLPYQNPKLLQPSLELRCHLGYFLFTVLLMVVEIIIAKYSSGWIRSYLGDMLVVMLIYSALMTVFRANKSLMVVATLLFAFAVEISQYFNLAEILGFERGSLGYVILGNTFSLEDLACYLIGGLLILLIERRVASKAQSLKSSHLSQS